MARGIDEETVLPLNPHSTLAAILPESPYRTLGSTSSICHTSCCLSPLALSLYLLLSCHLKGRESNPKANLQPKETREEINAPPTHNYTLYYKADRFVGLFLCFCFLVLFCFSVVVVFTRSHIVQAGLKLAM